MNSLPLCRPAMRRRGSNWCKSTAAPTATAFYVTSSMWTGLLMPLWMRSRIRTGIDDCGTRGGARSLNGLMREVFGAGLAGAFRPLLYGKADRSRRHGGAIRSDRRDFRSGRVVA